MIDSDVLGEKQIDWEDGAAPANNNNWILVESASVWLINFACAFFCVAAVIYGISVLISLIPVPLVNEQPSLMQEYNRADLASVRYLILHGQLWWPPPPPCFPPS